MWLGGEVEAVTTTVEDGEAEKTVYPVLLPARPVPPPPKTVRAPPPSTRKNKTCTLLLPSYPPCRIFI